MSELQCPRCGRKLTMDNGAAFCPFCGGTLAQAKATPDDDAVRALLAQVEAQTDPRKKHELLLKAQAQYPDNLSVAEELLFLGRLYERNAKTLDFSVIKCYLLNLYLEPEALSQEKIEAMRRELFDHPDLNRCLELCDDRAVFLNRYLMRLATQFIDLFLRGSSQYMHRFFGFGLDSRAPKLLAPPMARMIAGVRDDHELTAEQRSMLMHALFAAFSTQMSGDTQWLQKAMAERGVALD